MLQEKKMPDFSAKGNLAMIVYFPCKKNPVNLMFNYFHPEGSCGDGMVIFILQNLS